MKGSAESEIRNVTDLCEPAHQFQKNRAIFPDRYSFFFDCRVLIHAAYGQESSLSQPGIKLSEQQIIEKLESLGGRIFKESGRVVDVNMDEPKLRTRTCLSLLRSQT